MKYLFSVLLFVIVLAPLISQAIEDSEDTMNIKSVTILATSSLTVPVTEIAKQLSRETKLDVNTVYENSFELMHKIEEGDPGDIIITSSKTFIDKMKERGLVEPHSVKIIAGNSLSLVASKQMVLEKSEDIKTNLQRVKNKALLIIGDPTVTALGESTKESLQKLKMWSVFEGFVVNAPTSAKAMDLIIKGQSAGIVYTTDALLYSEKINNLGMIPENSHAPINYYAAVVVGDNMDYARVAMKFLDSKFTKEILKQSGFMVK